MSDAGTHRATLEMRTDELIEAIAHHGPECRQARPAVSLTAASLVALAAAVLLSVIWLKIRPDLTLVASPQNALFAIKLAFSVAVTAGALLLLRDLSVPGRPFRRGVLFVTIVLAMMAILAVLEVVISGLRYPEAHVGHGSWLDCLWEIPALGAPAFLVLVAAVRQLAPTELSFAGGVLGLLAGAIGAIGYALHCSDDSIALVAASYSLAMAETTLLGALLGPYLLRWK